MQIFRQLSWAFFFFWGELFDGMPSACIMKYAWRWRAPAMPKPSKGTEFCKLLLSQASKDMQEPLVPMAIPALAAHLSEVEFMYCDNKILTR